MNVAKFDEFPDKDNGTYVYVRVSTDRQSTEGQLLEVYEWCLKNRIYPPSKNIFIDEAVSGKIKWEERKFNDIVNLLKKGDQIIVPELSRIGRNMTEIQSLMHILVVEKKIVIHDIKNNLKLDGSFQSSIMAMLFSMCAQMERQLISERTKRGMKTEKVKENLKKRRPRFRNKCHGHEEDIKKMLSEGKSKPEIAKLCGVHNAQLHKFIKVNKLDQDLI